MKLCFRNCRSVLTACASFYLLFSHLANCRRSDRSCVTLVTALQPTAFPLNCTTTRSQSSLRAVLHKATCDRESVIERMGVKPIKTQEEARKGRYWSHGRCSLAIRKEAEANKNKKKRSISGISISFERLKPFRKERTFMDFHLPSLYRGAGIPAHSQKGPIILSVPCSPLQHAPHLFPFSLAHAHTRARAACFVEQG